MIIEKVEIQNGKYAITFKVSDSKTETIEVTSDGLEKMLNLFHQAKLAHSGEVVEAEAKIKIDLEMIENKMSGLRDEFKTYFQKQSTDLQNDVDYMKSIMNKIEAERGTILTQINVEIKKQLDNLALILTKVKETETAAFESVRTREQEIQRIADDLKNKSELSWESINNVKEETHRDKAEFDKIKKDVTDAMSKANISMADNRKEFENTIAVLKKSTESFISESTESLKSITEKSQKTIGVIYDKIEEARKYELKEKYLKSEIKRREDVNALKTEFIRNNCEKKIKEIESLKLLFDTDSKYTIDKIRKTFASAIRLIKSEPESFESQISRINVYIDEFNQKNLASKKRKNDEMKKLATKAQQKIKSDSLFGGVKNKIKAMLK